MSTIPLRLDFEFDPAQLPINGLTPEARHCSWTGAQAAAVPHGRKLAKLLAWFSRYPRMTFAEFARLMATEQHRLCSTWQAAKQDLGWICGTGQHESYVVYGRVVHREIHEITDKGRQAAFDQLKARVREIEAGA